MGASAPRGFTLVEVLLALVLLSFMVMGFQAATGEIIRQSAESDHASVAARLVENRLDRIRLDPEYERLEGRYAGREDSVPSYPGLSRTTTIRRTRAESGRGVLDYVTVTVTVAGPGLGDPVSRTVVIAAP